MSEAEQQLQGALNERAGELIQAGRFLYARGWVPATSGNFSARLDATRFAITVSGRNKGKLREADIMAINDKGHGLESNKLPSAETPLHTSLYRRLPRVGAVLHTHSVNATVISRLYQSSIELQDYELLKAFGGIGTHATSVKVPIFGNDQNVVGLAAKVEEYMDQGEPIYGYLIEGHGLYTWGGSVEEALRHVEALEFLFECEMRVRGVRA